MRSRRSVLGGAVAGLIDAVAGCVDTVTESVDEFQSAGSTRTIPGAAAQQQVDGRRTGRVSDVAGPRSGAELAWTRHVGRWADASPVVRDSTVFVGAETSEGGRVRALDAASGNKVWTVNVEFATSAVSLAIDGAGLVATTGLDALRLGLADGEELQRTEASGHSVIALDDDRLYQFGTGAVYGIPLSFEDTGWSYEHGRVASGPAADGEHVYLGTYDDEVIALTVAGEVDWIRDLDRDVSGGPTVTDDLVLVGAADFAVHALDRTTGEPVWHHDTQGAIYGSPAVGHGRAYAGSVDGTVRALDLATGVEQWRFDVGDSLETGYRVGPVVDDETVFVAGIDGTITGLDAASGDELWSVTIDGVPGAPPTLAEGHLYVVDRGGTVHAIREGSAP